MNYNNSSTPLHLQRKHQSILPYYRSQAQFQQQQSSPKYIPSSRQLNPNSRQLNSFYKSSYSPLHEKDNASNQLPSKNEQYQQYSPIVLRSYYSDKNKDSQSQKSNSTIGYGHLLQKNNKSKSPIKIVTNQFSKQNVLLNNYPNQKKNQFQSPKINRISAQRSKKFISQIRKQMIINSPRGKVLSPRQPIRIQQYSGQQSQNMEQSQVKIANFKQSYQNRYEQGDSQLENQNFLRNQIYNEKLSKNQIFELTYKQKKLQNQLQLKAYEIQKLTKNLQSIEARHSNQLNSIISQHKFTLSKKDHQKEMLMKEFQHYENSIANLQKNKAQKQKNFMEQINKYNARLVQSESLRSSASLEYEQKMKQRIQKKDKLYKEILEQKQNKYKLSLNDYKNIISKKQDQIKVFQQTVYNLKQNCTQFEQNLLKLRQQLKRSKNDNNFICTQERQQLKHVQNQNKSIRAELQKIIRQKTGYQFQFCSNQTLIKRLTKQNESLREELQYLREMHESIKFKGQRKQIELNQMNEQHYEEASKMKEIIFEKQEFVEQIKINMTNLTKQVQKVRSMNEVLEDKLQEQKEASQNHLIQYQKCAFQCQLKNQEILKLSQQNIYLENQKSTLVRNLNDIQEEYKRFKAKIQHQITYNSIQKNLSNQSSMYSQNSTTDWVQRIEGLQTEIGQLMQNFRKQKNNMLKVHQKETIQMKQKILNVQKLLIKKDAQLLELKQKLRQVQLSKHKACQQSQQTIIKMKEQIKKLQELKQINEKFKNSIKIKFDQQLQKGQEKLIAKDKQLQIFKKTQTKRFFQLKQNFQELITKLVESMKYQIMSVQYQFLKLNISQKRLPQANPNENYKDKETIITCSKQFKGNQLQIFKHYFQQFFKSNINYLRLPSFQKQLQNSNANTIFYNLSEMEINFVKGIKDKLCLMQEIIQSIKQQIRQYDFQQKKRDKFIDEKNSLSSDKVKKLQMQIQKERLRKLQQQAIFKNLEDKYQKLVQSHNNLQRCIKNNQNKLQEKESVICDLQIKLKLKKEQQQQTQQKMEKLQKQIKKLKPEIDRLEKQLFQKQLKAQKGKTLLNKYQQMLSDQEQEQEENMINQEEDHGLMRNHRFVNFQSQITQTKIQQVPLRCKEKTPKKTNTNYNTNKSLTKNSITSFQKNQNQFERQQKIYKKQLQEDLQYKVLHYQRQIVPEYENKIKQLQQHFFKQNQKIQYLQDKLLRTVKQCQQKQIKFSQNSHKKLIDLQSTLKNYQLENQKLFAQNKQSYQNIQRIEGLQEKLAQQTYIAKIYKEDLIKKQTMTRQLQNQITFQAIRYKVENDNLNEFNQQLKMRINALQNYNAELLSKSSNLNFNMKSVSDNLYNVQNQKSQRNSSLVMIAEQNQKITFYKQNYKKIEELQGRVDLYQKMLKDKQIDMQNQRQRHQQAIKQKQQLASRIQQLVEQLSEQFRQMEKLALEVEQLKFINMSKSLNYESNSFSEHKANYRKKQDFRIDPKINDSSNYLKFRKNSQKSNDQQIYRKEQRDQRERQNQISFNSFT